MELRANQLTVLAAVAVIGATIWVAPAGILRVVTAVLLLGAELGLLMFPRLPQPAAAGAVIGACAASLAALVVAPHGLAVVIFLVSIARLPHVLDDRWLWPVVVTFSLGLSVAVGFITDSWLGTLAGTGVPFLAQRTVEQLQLAAERDRAVRLLDEVEAARGREAEAAALAERGRIARDMHDVLAHSLAGLSLQLQAVRALAARENVSPTITEPLDRAAQLARDGVDEARSVVGALRTPTTLGVGAVAGLVERFPGTARLQTSGPVGQLSADVGAAMYRCVQEALTNCARYASGSAVWVELDWTEDALRVRVTDDGPADSGRAPTGPVGSGMGLLGMQERLKAVGGSLRAGPSGRGYVVEATVPTAAVASSGAGA